MRGADGSTIEAIEARLGRRTLRPGPAGGSAVIEVGCGRRQPGPVDMRNARGSAICCVFEPANSPARGTFRAQPHVTKTRRFVPTNAPRLWYVLELSYVTKRDVSCLQLDCVICDQTRRFVP